MKANYSNQYLLIVLVLFGLTSMSPAVSDSFRTTTASFLSPIWSKLAAVKHYLGSLTKTGESPNTEEFEQLQVDYYLIKNELQKVLDLIEEEHYLKNQLKAMKKIPQNAQIGESLLKNHHEQLKKRISLHLDSLPTRIIYRSPSTWYSSFWVNVGSKNVEYAGILAKNSPVVIGNNVIGIVDYVGKSQSRVRLITDPGLTPSVRVVREDTSYLAKGELNGSHDTSWRSRPLLLKGSGFNYDFPDEYGPSRDLRTGYPNPPNPKIPNVPIVQPGDLLVTTGMDGVFPPGLHVGIVDSINLLKEGDYHYTLEAKPVIQNFDQLSTVFILPPVGFDPDDQAPIIGWEL